MVFQQLGLSVDDCGLAIARVPVMKALLMGEEGFNNLSNIHQQFNDLMVRFSPNLSVSMSFKLAGRLGLLLPSSPWRSRSWHGWQRSQFPASDRQTLFVQLLSQLDSPQESIFSGPLPTLLSDAQARHTSKAALCR